MRDLKKILIIQTAFLGDVVLATGVLEKLHEHFPDAQLDVMVRKGNESLFHDHPYLHRVYIFNKKKKLRSLIANIIRIKQVKYDLVVNLQRFLSSGLITVLSGARRTAGFSKNPMSLFFTERFRHEISGDTHEVSRNHTLIEDFTDSIPEKPALYPSGACFNDVSRYKDQPYVCIAPASIWFTKQYPAEKWVDLINRLPGYKVYLLGAPSDARLCQKIQAKTKHSGITVLAGKLSLLQSAALMKDAVMNFVNDSAPMHLASAVNAPVTAIYCSTIPEFGFGPLSGDSFVVETRESLDCRPCGLHGYKECPEGHFRCAKTIKTEQLLNSLKKYEG